MYENTQVISIEELKKLAEGELVELPSFKSDERITVRLRRPSMMYMIKSGKIPNELLVEANKLFIKGSAGAVAGQKELDDPQTLVRMVDLLEYICEEAFVEPTYKQIKDAGIKLTDSQLLAVFEYTQNGVANLKSFR